MTIPEKLARTVDTLRADYLDDDLARIIAQIPAMLDVLRDLADYWDGGSPVHPGSEVSHEARAILRRAIGT